MNRTNMIFSTLIAMGISFAALSGAPAAMAETPANISVEVEGIETKTGNLMIALFKGEAAWKNSEAYSGIATAADANSVTALFEGIEPGEYGIRMYQDVNADGELNTGMFRIPTEPYGFSNDAPVRFGPPAWEDARFTVSENDQTMTINLTRAGR